MANNEIENIKGIGPKAAKTLVDCGFNTIEKLAKASADELSQLPGIGLATAEKMIQSANEELSSVKKPTAKAPAEKAETIPKTKVLDKDDIPKPPALKKVEADTTVRPSVKVAEPPTKKPAAKKPAAKKPVEKSKKTVTVTKGISSAAEEAIKKAPGMPKIKSKVSTKKLKPKKKVTLSKTYGIVHSVLHDASGKSGNNSIILHLHEMEMPITNYLGRKVKIHMVQSEKQLTGTISRIHGKRSSRNNAVIVRFQKGVSPHIVAAKASIN